MIGGKTKEVKTVAFIGGSITRFWIDIARNGAALESHPLDGCHPNENGHRRIAVFLTDFCQKKRLI